MNCSEFRREYQSVLDGARPGEPAQESSAHLAGCAGCAAFARAIKALDNALRAQPRFSLPELLLRDILAIPLNEMIAEYSLKRYVRKGIVMTLSGVGLLVLGMSVLPPELLFWLRLSILTVGLTYFWVKVLSQKRIAASLE
jgi:predicted anti-sigma-YlaC factor YlaD